MRRIGFEAKHMCKGAEVEVPPLGKRCGVSNPVELY